MNAEIDEVRAHRKAEQYPEDDAARRMEGKFKSEV